MARCLFPLRPSHLVVLSVVVLSAASTVWARQDTEGTRSAYRTPASELVVKQATTEAQPVEVRVMEEFAPGYALLRNGDFGGAEAFFARYVDDGDPARAAEAWLARAAAAQQDGRHEDAAAYVAALRERFPGTAEAGEAALVLGNARRALGDCGGAIDAFRLAAQERPLLAAEAHALEAICFESLDQPADVVAVAQATLDADPPRMLRLEALERQAQAYLKLGNEDAALDIYAALLGESRTRWYTAELLYTVGSIHRAAGRLDRAAERLASVVIDYPESARAPEALDALNEMQASDRVSWYQAGLVRLNQRRYQDAVDAFGQSLAIDPAGPQAPAASFQRGVAQVRLGDVEAGVADLVAVADHWPDSPLAPQGLLRAGQVRESEGQFDLAAALYDRLVATYPGSASAVEGRFRRGFARYVLGDPQGAAALWEAALGVDTEPEARARLLLWRGKARALQGDVEGARGDWQAARDLAPASFPGVRARDLLNQNEAGIAWPAAEVPADGQPGLDDWLASLGEDPAALKASIAAEPRFQRAAALLRLGLRLYARWEVDDLAEVLAGQPARLSVLASMLHAHGAYDMASRVAQSALAALPNQTLFDAPPGLQRLAYPLPYPELLEWQRQERGADPFLLAALMRQESGYDPRATSSANARGLTQVIPSTGEMIASRLGYQDFDVDDLYRPVVSVRFGALYLVDMLGRFGQRVYPALASYNAGPGASERWLEGFGTDDMDVWAERVPYAETNLYIRKVFANYGAYRLIYGLENG